MWTGWMRRGHSDKRLDDVTISQETASKQQCHKELMICGLLGVSLERSFSCSGVRGFPMRCIQFFLNQVEILRQSPPMVCPAESAGRG